MYKLILRPILFLLPPEIAHNFTFLLLRFASIIPGIRTAIRFLYQLEDQRLERELFGIHFSNPIGLAAGLDKDAEAFDILGDLGFGFIEVGTVVPEPQPGNPKPRLYRLPADKALINRMGFNSKGLAYTVKQLQQKKSRIIIAGNIGKNKSTPTELTVEDYEQCFEALFPYVDFFVINVSSPNTPNLRALQDKGPLNQLLGRLQTLNGTKQKPKPLLLKIAPDLSSEQLDEIIEIVQNQRINGIVATNTTISREGLSYPQEFIGRLSSGGLSGLPLTKRNTEIIRYLSQKSQGQLPIIAVGGIMSAEDACEKIQAGASLVQLYTGFIYEGPGLIKAIKQKLLNS